MRRLLASAAVGVLLVNCLSRAQTLPANQSLGNDPSHFDEQIDTAFLHRDVAFIPAVAADDARFTHGDGTSWTKQQWLDAVGSFTGSARSIDLVQVEQHGDV